MLNLLNHSSNMEEAGGKMTNEADLINCQKLNDEFFFSDFDNNIHTK